MDVELLKLSSGSESGVLSKSRDWLTSMQNESSASRVLENGR